MPGTNTPPWGIAPPAGTKVRVCWGARAIFDRNHMIDIVHNRQGTGEGGDLDERQALVFWVNKYALPEMKRLALSIYPEDDKQIEYKSHGFRMVGNPRQSHGYLYLGAWSTTDTIVMPPEPRLWTSPNKLWFIARDSDASLIVARANPDSGATIATCMTWRTEAGRGSIYWESHLPDGTPTVFDAATKQHLHVPKFVREKVGALLPAAPPRFQKRNVAAKARPRSTFMDDDEFSGGRRHRW